MSVALKGRLKYLPIRIAIALNHSFRARMTVATFPRALPWAEMIRRFGAFNTGIKQRL